MGERPQKIGIMGGTFDPIHMGHLVMAESVRMEYELTKVLFIPTGTSPHKHGTTITPAIDRYIMTMMATYSNPYFFVSPIERDRPGPSFTIDTVRELVAEYKPGTEFYFLTGTDAILELHTWNNIDELLDLCHFVAASRPGKVSSIAEEIERLGPKAEARIHRLTTPELEISATDIRERVRLGKSIRYFVPESVEHYIHKEGLYLKEHDGV
jgi:nicotinate-nucleotide adenylyltransferase